MKKLKILGILILVLIALLVAAASGGFAWYFNKYVNIDEIYPGVSIGGMDMGGLGKAEAQKRVDAYIAQVSDETVTLKAGKKEQVISMADLGLVCTDSDLVGQAWSTGRTGNLFERSRAVLELTRNNKDFPISFSFDEETAKKKLKKLEKTFLAKKKNATIKRKKGKFVVTKEVNGVDMDLDQNADAVLAILTASDWNRQSLVYELDYTLDKAKHTKKELSVIKDKLGTFTTSYAGSAEGRCVNVQNGARLINGTLLYPGDSLSVHDTVTPFSKENGYRLAGSYENGSTIQTYGGGICQVSTTLYNAVLRSELEVLERSNHTMTVHYVQLSEDAAIAGDVKDFRFKNNLKYPVYIVGTTDKDKKTITFTIYGKEYRSKDRSIEFESETVATRPPQEEIIKDKNLKKGKREVIKQGHTGYTARLWKIIHVKGKEDQRVQVNSSYYISTPRQVRVGTKTTGQEKKKEEAGTDGEKAEEKKQDQETE